MLYRDRPDALIRELKRISRSDAYSAYASRGLHPRSLRYRDSGMKGESRDNAPLRFKWDARHYRTEGEHPTGVSSESVGRVGSAAAGTGGRPAIMSPTFNGAKKSGRPLVLASSHLSSGIAPFFLDFDEYGRSAAKDSCCLMKDRPPEPAHFSPPDHAHNHACRD